MNILYCASEALPFAMSGGLGDVAGMDISKPAGSDDSELQHFVSPFFYAAQGLRSPSAEDGLRDSRRERAPAQTLPKTIPVRVRTACACRQPEAVLYCEVDPGKASYGQRQLWTATLPQSQDSLSDVDIPGYFIHVMI